MLAHSDIIGAKAIAQLGWVAPGVLVEALLEGVHRGDGDLIYRLQESGLLSPACAHKVRAFVGRFHIACHESVVLRLLEARGLPNLAALIARAEVTGHEQRLAALARAEGYISEDEAWELEQRAQQEVYCNGVTLVERYRRERFAGVRRPLIPGGVMLTESFRVSRLFRSHPFQVQVLKEIGRQRDEARAKGSLDPPVRLTDDEETVSLAEAPITLSSRLSSLPDISAIGPYKVRRCLGRGGMAAVYLAVRSDDPVQTEVAVKVLAAGAKPDNQLRFRREVAVSARLQHPSLVRLLDSGELPDGTLFMVLPAYRSTSVRSLLCEGLVAPRLAFQILEQLLEALSAVHAAGVVHRDVKPGNILLTQEARALRLIDFGISHAIEQQAHNSQYRTGVGDFVGTIQYTAPENLGPDPVDGRADLYSVGILTHELLTGRTPFGGMPRAQVLIAQLRQTPPLLSEVRSNVEWSPELEFLVRRLLSKRPDDRPSTAEEVLEALRGGLASESLRLLEGGSVNPISGLFPAVRLEE